MPTGTVIGFNRAKALIGVRVFAGDYALAQTLTEWEPMRGVRLVGHFRVVGPQQVMIMDDSRRLEVNVLECYCSEARVRELLA
jgi:hypothetical protein